MLGVADEPVRLALVNICANCMGLVFRSPGKILLHNSLHVEHLYPAHIQHRAWHRGCNHQQQGASSTSCCTALVGTALFYCSRAGEANAAMGQFGWWGVA